MRQDLMNMIEKATAQYQNETLALPQLEYMVAKSLLDTLREQAEKEYMWTGDSSLHDETIDIIADHDVEVDKKYGIYETEEYCKEKRDNLIAWSQEMSIKIARKCGKSEHVIQDIINMHQNINQHPVLRRKLIDTALKLNAQPAI